MHISILPITTVASLGNTSNADQGIRWLYNKRALDVIPKLEVAVNQLGTSTDSDYWKATPGTSRSRSKHPALLGKNAPRLCF